jgi:hypothetical protein
MLLPLLAARLRERLGPAAALALKHFESDYFDSKLRVRQACQRADMTERSDVSIVSSSGSSDARSAAQGMPESGRGSRSRSGVNAIPNEPVCTYPLPGRNERHPTSNNGERIPSSRAQHANGHHDYNAHTINQHSQPNQLGVYGQQGARPNYPTHTYDMQQQHPDTSLSQGFPARQPPTQFGYPSQSANPNPFSTTYSPYGHWGPSSGV